jgi:hypothetical protein
MLPVWRLDPPFRFAIYIAFAVLFASGAVWLVADQMKESANGEFWQQAEPVDAELEPVTHDAQHGLEHAWIVVIEIRLMRVEAVPEIAAGDGIPGPIGALGVEKDDPRSFRSLSDQT